MDTDTLFLAVLESPDDLQRRAVYADSLQERGDPRGDYLRLLLSLKGLKKGDPQVRAIAGQLRARRLGLDRHWTAVVDDFDCRVREVRTIHLRISTYGPAPKKYGGATKVGLVERALLARAGWEHAGDGQHYSYVRRPEGAKAKDPVIPAEVPTDVEVDRMASGFHQKGEKMIQSFGPWIVQYWPAGSVRYRTRVVSRPDEDQPWNEVRGPAEFEFGVGAPWSVTLVWTAGSATPTWSRSVDKEVASPG